MRKTGNRVVGMLVAGLLVSSITARAEDETPTPVPAQDNAGQSTLLAADDTQQPISPPVANPPQHQSENNAASNGRANAAGTAPASNDNANDDKAAAGQHGDGSAAAGAAKSGAKEPASAEKRLAAKKAAADKVDKAKNAKSGPAAATPEIAKIAPCPDLNAAQVAELIDQDYTQNRFQRSEQDQQAAGGRNINAWVNLEDVTGVGDVWQTPLKVRGNEQDRTMPLRWIA